MALTRTLKITYGTFEIGVGTEGTYLPNSHYRVAITPYQTRISFRVFVVGSTHADFNTKKDALEAAYKTPKQKLVIEMDGETDYSFDPDDRTGFDSFCEIENTGDGESNTTREYQVTVFVKTPPTDSAGNGSEALVLHSVTLETNSNGIRTLTITGHYLNTETKGALENYSDNINSLIGAVKTKMAPDTVWDELPAVLGAEDPINSDTRATFQRVFREMIYKETLAAGDDLDDADISNVFITATPSVQWPGDYQLGATVRRPVTVTGRISCLVIKTKTDSELKDIWEKKLQPNLIDYLRKTFDFKALTITGITPNYAQGNNEVSGTITGTGITANTNIIRLKKEVDISQDNGKELVPLWNKNPFSKREDQNPATLVRTTIETKTYYRAGIRGNTFDQAGFRGRRIPEPLGENASGWVNKGHRQYQTSRTIGDPTKANLHMTFIDEVLEIREEWKGGKNNKDISVVTNQGFKAPEQEKRVSVATSPGGGRK